MAAPRKHTIPGLTKSLHFQSFSDRKNSENADFLRQITLSPYFSLQIYGNKVLRKIMNYFPPMKKKGAWHHFASSSPNVPLRGTNSECRNA